MRSRPSLREAMCLVVLAACGPTAQPSVPAPSACVPGRLEPCPCPGRPTGVQQCNPLGTFDACLCEEATDAGARDSSRVVNYDGPELLVDVFVIPDGVVVVDEVSIQLLGPSGEARVSVLSPRQILTADLLGEQLVVAGRARLQLYDLQLELQREITLKEGCAAVAILEGDTAICRTVTDDPVRAVIYDLKTGARRAESREGWGLEVPARVPGRRMVVDRWGQASVLLLNPEGAPLASIFGQSPPTRGVSAFDGVPARHLVSADGRLLDLASCESRRESCLQLAGFIGTGPEGRWFLAMDSSPEGELYAVSPTSGSTYSGCAQGCEVQRIDIAQRVVRASVGWLPGDTGEVVLARYDPFRRRVLVGRHRRAPQGSVVGYTLTAFAP